MSAFFIKKIMNKVTKAGATVLGANISNQYFKSIFQINNSSNLI
ncbi:MAG: hypothetical protein ACJA2G_000135 [Cognaticolwellia sp.]|jgi:hypothetical protein